MSEPGERLQTDEALARALGRKLREGDGLDDALGARLALARARALESRGAPRVAPWLVLTGGIAAAMALALVVLWPRHAGDAVQAFDGLEIATDEMELEFYEDLDLYRWIEQGDQDHV